MSAFAELDDPRTLAITGERIYAEHYKEEFEGKFSGQFAAIDIGTGRAFVAEYPEDAIAKARVANGDGLLHLVRIGSASAYRMSFFFASDDAGVARAI